MKRQYFRYYLYGENSDWQAICTDLDIAVQGDSLEETKSLLTEAVAGYLEFLLDESAVDRKRLLNRKAPLWLRTEFYLRYVLHRLGFEKYSRIRISRELISPHSSFLM